MTLAGVVVPDKANGSYRVAILDDATGDTIARPEVNVANGTFVSVVGEGHYTVFVNGEKYLPSQEAVSIPDNYSSNRIAVEVKLASKPEPKPVEEVKPEPKVLVAEAKVVPPPTAVVPTPTVVIPEVKPADKPLVAEAKPVEKKPLIAKTPKPEKAKPFIKPKPVPKPKPEPKLVEVVKPEPKFVVQTDSSASGGVVTYSIQLMALKTVAPAGTFKNVAGVEVTTSPDGYYRYSVGNTTEVNYANVLLEKMHALGYADAFIRKNHVPGRFTIQLMAVKREIDLTYFSNLANVSVAKGVDGYYRYTLGEYSSSAAAKEEVSKLAKLGYNQAFVKLMSKSE